MKTALITGAAGNLGRAVVEQFLQDGYKAIAVDSPGKENRFTSDKVEFVGVDLSNEDQVENAFSNIEKNHSIDAALFLAGGYHYGGLEGTTGEIIDQMFTMNFKTAFFLSKKVFAHMKEKKQGGRLVFVGARPSLDPKAGKDSFAYSLSKRLVFQLSDLLNAEGAALGITSTVIVPSIIDTPPNRKVMADADFSKWVTPEAIAKVMAFACSDEASPVREGVIKVYGQS